MIIKNPKFEISVMNQSQYPKNGLPEIVLAGKSNVGKSSFVNAMIKNPPNIYYVNTLLVLVSCDVYVCCLALVIVAKDVKKNLCILIYSLIEVIIAVLLLVEVLLECLACITFPLLCKVLLLSNDLLCELLISVVELHELINDLL